MQETDNLLHRNYADHRAFNFEQNSWEIPIDKLDAFNNSYEIMYKFSLASNASSQNSMLQETLAILQTIFNYMQTQATDKYENEFLKELFLGCSRLVKEEFKWYSKPPHRNCADLSNETAQENINLMLKKRYFLGQISNSSLLQIQHLSRPVVNALKNNATNGRLTREDLSINSGKTIKGIVTILNNEFKKLGVLDVISAYMGRKFHVRGAALELSVAGAGWWGNAINDLDCPPKTLYAHLDETISCPKSILYLTDVDEDSGPTSCYPGIYESLRLSNLQELIGRVIGTVGSSPDSLLNEYYGKTYHQSMSSGLFRRHFMRLPRNLRFNSHMGWDILPKSDLESEFIASETKVIGPAGTFIAFDGAHLVHRGGLVEKDERVALQIIFSDVTFSERAMNKLKRMIL